MHSEGGDASKCPFMNSGDSKSEARSGNNGVSGYYWTSLAAGFALLIVFMMGRRQGGEVVFQASDLENDPRILLSITGVVYDVSSGARHYGEGGPYSMLARKDASRAYGTGDISPEGLIDDASDLSGAQCLGVQSYINLYETRKEYVRLGVLAGRYWDENGEPTPAYMAFQACVARGQQEEKDKKESENVPCDVERRKGLGTRVVCEEGVLVPRIVNFAAKGGGTSSKCFCFKVDVAMKRKDLLVYPDCESHSSKCWTEIEKSEEL